MREVGGSSPSSPISVSLRVCPQLILKRQVGLLQPLAEFEIWENIPKVFNTRISVLAFEEVSEVLTVDDPTSLDLVGYAAGRGHRDFPCLSRTENPSSCVPALDFSPWVRERVRRDDVEGLAEYLWRLRRASLGIGSQAHQRYVDLARAIMAIPLDRYLARGSEEAYTDLRVALIILAAHESFSGFIMAGEAADYMAAVMAPHSFSLADGQELLHQRNTFVLEMSRSMDYWALWSPLAPDAIRSPVPPLDTAFQLLLSLLARLPLGARAHAVDALRHLSADLRAPRSLGSLCRHETRRHGIDCADSARLIMESGLVTPASDVETWLNGCTRRDLLKLLSDANYPAPKSWSKERLASVAMAERAEAVREKMARSGTVELAPEYAEAAQRLRGYLEDVKETWRVWLGFGTGVALEELR
jgi:hypothetical protein